MFLLPTHNGQPLPLLRENEKLCIILSSYFVKLINTTVRHPIIPKQYVRSDVLQSPNAWGQQPPRVECTHNEHWGVPILMKESCANRTYSAPSPSPFPFSHHGQASCSAACPWVRKKGEGERGWGSVNAAHTQWAAPVSADGQ